MKNKPNVILHGECMIFKSTIPSDAKEKIVNAPYLIVAPSETTGNHHVVNVSEGVKFFEDSKGTVFMDVAKEAIVRCVLADRHDAVTIPAGTYEFGVQQEYDPFTARLNKVRD